MTPLKFCQILLCKKTSSYRLLLPNRCTLNKAIVDSSPRYRILMNSTKHQLSYVQLVLSPGELYSNITPCLILAHWQHGITRGPSSGLHSARYCCLDYPAPRPQCAVNLDRNLKPKLAIMRQRTSVIDRRTDRRTITS